MRRLAMLAFALLAAGCSPDPCSPYAAKTAAGDYMKLATRDPRQTKIHDLVATSRGSCKYEVSGSMEGANAFGAMTEVRFTVQAELNGNGRWNIDLTRAPGVLELMH